MYVPIESNWHYYVARVFMCGRLSHTAFGYDIFVPVKQAKLYSSRNVALQCVAQMQLPQLPAETLDLSRCVSEISSEKCV